MIRVKKTQYPKITDDDISKVSTDIKNFVIKMKNKIKKKTRLLKNIQK